MSTPASENNYWKRILSGVGFIAFLASVPLSLFLYLGPYRILSFSHFDISRREGVRWSFEKGRIIDFSDKGATNRIGSGYVIGPFQINDWQPNRR